MIPNKKRYTLRDECGRINTNFIAGVLFAFGAPSLMGLTAGNNPGAYWPISFLFVTALVTFVWAVVSVVDTYKKEGLPYFTPLASWRWCFAIWLLSISIFSLDACRARIQHDFSIHFYGNAIKFNLALWGLKAFIQYVRFRFPDLIKDTKRFIFLKRLDKKDRL